MFENLKSNLEYLLQQPENEEFDSQIVFLLFDSPRCDEHAEPTTSFLAEDPVGSRHSVNVCMSRGAGVAGVAVANDQAGPIVASKLPTEEAGTWFCVSLSWDIFLGLLFLCVTLDPKVIAFYFY